MIKRLSLVILLMVIITTLVAPSLVKAQANQVVLQGGYVATVVGFTKDGRAIYQTNLAAPTYCDDLKTPISTEWYEQTDGTFKSGDNKFDSNVSNDQVTLIKGQENIKWTPELTLTGANYGQDLKLSVEDVKPEILDVDPMNENYNRNTLVWHYSNGVDRYLRLIEGQVQEYFQINQPLTTDLVINPHAVQTRGFNAYEKAIAYDDFGTGIKLTEDSNKKVTIKASSIKQSSITKNVNEALTKYYKDEVVQDQQQDIKSGQEPEVQYPIVIDPNYTFISSASDGYSYASDSVYNTAWASAIASYSVSNILYCRVGQSLDGVYYILRSALYFDTSALTSSVTITSVDLKLYGYEDYSYTNFNITLQQGGTTYPSDPLVSSDYDKAKYPPIGVGQTSVGVLSTVGFSTVAYNTLSFNAADFAMINKTGTTKLLVRSSRDIAGTAPSGWEFIGYYTYEKGANYWPQLIVTFTAANPAITATDASSVAKYSAQLNAHITDDGGDVAGNTYVRFGYGTTTQAGFSGAELVTNGSFEINDPPDDWVGSGLNPATISRDGTYYKVGTHSMKVIGSGVDSWGGQSINAIPYRGKTLTFGCWGLNLGTANEYIGIADDIGETASNTPIYSDSSWWWTTATRTISLTAVTLNVICRSNGAGIITYFDGATLTENLYDITTPFIDINSGGASYYATGSNAYVNVASLTDGTPYYYRAQVRNSTATVTSTNEITFTTLLSVHDVSVFNGVPNVTSIGLNWNMPSGASNVIIRASASTYPLTIADGNLVYSGTSTATSYTGLTAGTTYYFSIWGESGGDYSTNAKHLVVTTYGANNVASGGDSLPTPVLPASFYQPTDVTVTSPFSNLEPFYSFVKNAALSLDMPMETLTAVGALILIGIIGLVVLIGAHSLFGALMVMCVSMSLCVAMKILPWEFVGLIIPMALGAWATKSGEGSNV